LSVASGTSPTATFTYEHCVGFFKSIYLLLK
jgi:hypothetical protein